MEAPASSGSSSKRTQKTPSKRGKGLPRRAQDLSKEELLLTLRKKKECNAKALKIVEDMLERNVQEEWFLDVLQHINQSHLQDVVEERALMRLCGYPLCPNKLEDIPSQQFRISTKLNKVFDITERKNFCSNKCFKACKFIKDQMYTSPLWLRDIEPSVKFQLIPSTGLCGGAGDEVNVQVERVSKEEVRQLSEDDKFFSRNKVNREPSISEKSLADALNNLHCVTLMETSKPPNFSERNGMETSQIREDNSSEDNVTSVVTEKLSRGDAKQIFCEQLAERKLREESTFNGRCEKKVDQKEIPNALDGGPLKTTTTLSAENIEWKGVNASEETKICRQHAHFEVETFTETRSAKQPSLKLESFSVTHSNERSNSRDITENEIITGYLSKNVAEEKVSLQEDEALCQGNNPFDKTFHVGMSEKSNLTEVPPKIEARNDVEKLSGSLPSSTPEETFKLNNQNLDGRGSCTRKKPRKIQMNAPASSVSLKSLPTVAHVEKCVQEWFTMETMYFLFGESALKYMLEQKGESIQAHYKALRSLTWDPEKHERFRAICKRLSLLEIEDNNFDSQVMRSEADVKRKPLPDYNALKKEAETMELKIKAFYQGKMEIEERKVSFADDTKKDSAESDIDNEPQVPLVHLHSQRALRKKIVLDGLNRVLPDFLRTFGMRPSELSSSVRGLISTFALSPTNITFKPQDWSLLGLIVIKLLTLREPDLKQCLQREQSSTYLTLMLMSYKQEPGYLDRLLVWLTDIDKLLCRPQSSDGI